MDTISQWHKSEVQNEGKMMHPSRHNSGICAKTCVLWKIIMSIIKETKSVNFSNKIQQEKN